MKSSLCFHSPIKLPGKTFGEAFPNFFNGSSLEGVFVPSTASPLNRCRLPLITAKPKSEKSSSLKIAQITGNETSLPNDETVFRVWLGINLGKDGMSDSFIFDTMPKSHSFDNAIVVVRHLKRKTRSESSTAEATQPTGNTRWLVSISDKNFTQATKLSINDICQEIEKCGCFSSSFGRHVLIIACTNYCADIDDLFFDETPFESLRSYVVQKQSSEKILIPIVRQMESSNVYEVILLNLTCNEYICGFLGVGSKFEKHIDIVKTKPAIPK